MESKINIYLTAVRPVQTYAAQTRANKKKKKISSLELKTLSILAGLILRNRRRNKIKHK